MSSDHVKAPRSLRGKNLRKAGTQNAVLSTDINFTLQAFAEPGESEGDFLVCRWDGGEAWGGKAGPSQLEKGVFAAAAEPEEL